MAEQHVATSAEALAAGEPHLSDPFNIAIDFRAAAFPRQHGTDVHRHA